MKTLFTVMALVGTLLTTGVALAHPVGQNPTGEERSAFGAQPRFALPGDSSVRAQAARRSLNPAHDVYVGGRYVGSDPDPFIRLLLMRYNQFNMGG